MRCLSELFRCRAPSIALRGWSAVHVSTRSGRVLARDSRKKPSSDAKAGILEQSA